MYYNLEDIAPGPLIYQFKDLITAIKNIDNLEKEFKEKRLKVRDRFNKYIDGKSIQRILNFLGIKYKRNSNI